MVWVERSDNTKFMRSLFEVTEPCIDHSDAFMNLGLVQWGEKHRAQCHLVVLHEGKLLDQKVVYHWPTETLFQIFLEKNIFYRVWVNTNKKRAENQ